jgi:tRNA (Thr-GGU) A37 N-methylase
VRFSTPDTWQIRFAGVDLLDETRVTDLNPYVIRFDQRAGQTALRLVCHRWSPRSRDIRRSQTVARDIVVVLTAQPAV